MKRNLVRLSKHILQNNNRQSLPFTRFLSTQEAIERRHHLFELEKKRQLEEVGRIEKIEVNYKGLPEECTLVMNKDISTPYDCAKHLSEWHTDSSALALVDGETPWDMHRPLTQNCTLELQTFTASEPGHVNKAFWRSCSLLLGACTTTAFKDHVDVKLHSFPGPNIRSGSFIYDVELPSLPAWSPSQHELFTLSAEFVKLTRLAQPIHRLEVSEDLALEMFRDNEHKTKQIPSIAKANGKVVMYKVGKHVDISRGPMVGHSGQLGRVAVTAVHRIQGSADSDVKQLYRFQGVALPRGVMLDHFAFSILIDRAKKLNSARSPINPHVEHDDSDKESVAARAQA